MSVIHVRHIRKTLEGKYEGLIDLADWQEAPQEQQESAFLSRALAAYAVEQAVGIDGDVAASAVTDGR